ncbi:MAG: response regulator [Alphaproteobacteria bacterium]|nr:response regulator [Alphaproteobacteria bacterium]
MTILEHRVLMFPTGSLLDAMRRYCMRNGQPLPDAVPQDFAFDPTHEMALTLRFSSADNPGRDSSNHAFGRTQVIEALCDYCQEHHVKLPKRASKRLSVFHDHAAVLIQVGLERAGGEPQRDVITVRLVDVIQHGIPDKNATRSDIIKIIWNNTSFCIIDSNSETRRAIRNTIISCGARHICECHDETEFVRIQIDNDTKFDLIFVSVLRGMSCTDIIRIIRNAEFHSKFAICIAIIPENSSDDTFLLKSGCNEVLKIPFSMEMIKNLLEHVMVHKFLFRMHGKTVISCDGEAQKISNIGTPAKEMKK